MVVHVAVHVATSRASDWLLNARENEQLLIKDATTASIWPMNNPKYFFLSIFFFEYGYLIQSEAFCNIL